MPDYYEFREVYPRSMMDLVDVEQELFELPQKVGLSNRITTYTVLYNGLAGARDIQQGSANKC